MIYKPHEDNIKAIANDLGHSSDVVQVKFPMHPFPIAVTYTTKLSISLLISTILLTNVSVLASTIPTWWLFLLQKMVIYKWNNQVLWLLGLTS
jgi:hypothetical protein